MLKRFLQSGNWILILGMGLLAFYLLTVERMPERGGWPLLDEARDHVNARLLIEDGVIPAHGSVASFGVLNPPGIAYAHAIGIVFSPRDPVRAVQIGATVANLCAMLGLILVLRRCLPAWAVFLAVVIYALSATGFMMGATLWPRAHGMFLIGFIWGMLRWAVDRKPSGLGIALVAWGLGMYWFLEIAPLAAVFPVVFLISRPPLKWQPVGIALVALFIVWLPYLRLEGERSFEDLRVLLLTQRPVEDFHAYRSEILTNPDIPSLNDRPSNWQADWQHPPGSTQGKGVIRYVPEVGWIWTSLDRAMWGEVSGYYISFLEREGIFGFQGTDGVLYMQSGDSWVEEPIDRFIVEELGPPPERFIRARPSAWFQFWNQVVLSNVHASPKNPLVHAQGLLLILAVGLLFRPSNWKMDVGAADSGQKRWRVPVILLNDPQVIFLSILIPFVILLALAVQSGDWTDFSKRLTWLWIGQVALIVLAWPVFRSVHRFAGWGYLGCLLLSSAALISPQVKAEMERPRETAPPQIESVLIRLKGILDEEGRTRASIGYDIPMIEWIVAAHRLDPVYKIGTEIDLLLRYRFGITNTNQSAEGVVREDEFRIVQTQRFVDRGGENVTYFDLSGYPRMEIVEEWKLFALLRRVADPVTLPDHR